LGSQRMADVMSQLAENADFVLIDSPPCLLYADAVVLSPLTDGVLYVVRSGPQDKAAQKRVHKQLQQAKARILGVVFNDAEVEESASSYHYYYAHGSSSAESRALPPGLRIHRTRRPPIWLGVAALSGG